MATRDPRTVFEALVARVLRGDGVTSTAVRGAAAGTGSDGLAERVAPVIAKIRAHAYKITDDDIAALRAAGFPDDDDIFEVTIATVVGVAQRRLDAAMAAIDAAGARKVG